MEELIDQFVNDDILTDERIISAFKAIDRAEFLPDNVKDRAAENQPIPIGKDQTNSQPQTVATMLELLEPEKGDTVLDVGSGSGRTTALLAHIVGATGRVTSVEKIPSLCEFGYKNVDKYNFIEEGRVIHMCGDATKGVVEGAPYDRILVSAMAQDELPQKLIDQLKPDGVMVCPFKEALYKVTKTASGDIEKEKMPGFSFVPLVSD